TKHAQITRPRVRRLFSSLFSVYFPMDRGIKDCSMPPCRLLTGESLTGQVLTATMDRDPTSVRVGAQGSFPNTGPGEFHGVVAGRELCSRWMIAGVRSDLPTGTVTFLFTDIEGSTKLLRQLGAEQYADALADHRRVVRTACAEGGGVEVDT